MIKFTLPIEPQSKQRPRAGRGKVYTAKTREAEGLAQYRSTHNGSNPKYNKTDHG